MDSKPFIPVLELVELGEELSTHQPHHPDELHRGQAVAAAAADGGDDDVEGAAAGEVGDEPGADAVRGNLGVGLADVALDMVMVTKETLRYRQPRRQ
jgi:hypothetical protein